MPSRAGGPSGLAHTGAVATVDALLLVSFGGPERPEDIMPFLTRVTAGRVPARRLAEVAGHYHALGGRSPINEQNRGLAAELSRRLPVPVYWGNRHAPPYLAPTLERMRAAGVRHAAGFLTSSGSSWSSCRSYLDDLARARAQVGPGAPVVSRLRHYYDHPALVAAFADSTRAALAGLPPGAVVVFTAHSVPVAMDAASGPAGGLYARQLRALAGLVAGQAGVGEWELAWQSRSGPSEVAWLGPDVETVLAGLARRGVPAACAVPVGFASDHVEVAYDLDVAAAATAKRLGLAWARAATPGVGLADVAVALFAERYAGAPLRALTDLGPGHEGWCPDGCCGRGD